MIIDLSKILYENLYEVEVSEEVTIPREYLDGTDIKDISKVKVKGSISNNGEEYNLNVSVTGTMILTCARTLKDVNYPFNITIDEAIEENNEKSVQIVQNRLDIFPIIWQYILVEVPLRVLAEDADQIATSGSGWRLVTEDEKKEEIDPRLAKLSDFIKE